MVTQCPLCGTRFRITDSQLGRAEGRARCGACLEIFSARDNLAAEEENSPGTPGPAGPAGADEIAEDDQAGAGAGRPGPVGIRAGGREASGEDHPVSAHRRSARGRPRDNWWVRWALVVAGLALTLQLVLYLA